MNPVDTQYLETLCDALAAEYFEVSGFVELLEAEQLAIQAGATETLERLQPEKQVRMSAIRDHAYRRATCLRELGYGAGSGAIGKFVRDHPSIARRVDATWRSLVAKAWESRHLIRLNAHLVGMHLQHSQARIAALVGAAAPERSVYDEGGSITAVATGRSIAQA